ncbi:MAG TPA: radical SAM protein [Patescibacteria group bacterium]|nr:radical SAM protein [Patescibacteria group bacterium]
MIMFCDDREGMVFRPPSEANSFILRVTTGCSHNRCTFCQMYKDVTFRLRTSEEVSWQIQMAARQVPHLRRVFLADGNALVLPTARLLEILAQLAAVFPKLSRVTCYGGPRDILAKSDADLRALKAAGLQIIYLGMESGSDPVLTMLNKGANAAEMITAGQKVMASGIKLSVMVILGAGGQALSRQHGEETARAVNAIRPNMLAALTLMLHEGSELRRQADEGTFLPLSPYDIMQELQWLMAGLELPRESSCIFRCNHVSNLLPLAGTLPKDQQRLLAEIADGMNAVVHRRQGQYNDRGPF